MTYTQMPYRPKPVRPRRWPYIVAAVIGGLVLLTITLAIAASSIPERTKAAAPAPTFNAGTYEVGATVPAGTYKINCDVSGYYFLRGSSDPRDVVDTAWVFQSRMFSAKVGQFIQVAGEQCTFTRVRD